MQHVPDKRRAVLDHWVSRMARNDQYDSNSTILIVVFKFLDIYLNTNYLCIFLIAACTLIMSIVEQLSQLHATDIADTLATACHLLPQGVFKTGCTDAFQLISPLVIEL